MTRDEFEAVTEHMERLKQEVHSLRHSRRIYVAPSVRALRIRRLELVLAVLQRSTEEGQE